MAWWRRRCCPGRRSAVAWRLTGGGSIFNALRSYSDRDYLYDVFRTVQRLPAVTTLFDAQHNPIWDDGISGDAAKELIAFWC